MLGEIAVNLCFRLSLARVAWPALGSYKLGVLAEHVGAPAPTHRGLADVRATLAVLLAARTQLFAQ
jgi:DNA polymerase-3 subunit epsilon